MLYFSIPQCICLVQPVGDFDLLCLMFALIYKENDVFIMFLTRPALIHFVTLQSARRDCCSAWRSFLKSIIELREWRRQQWPFIVVFFLVHLLLVIIYRRWFCHLYTKPICSFTCHVLIFNSLISNLFIIADWIEVFINCFQSLLFFKRLLAFDRRFL
jgi:hypothetical protein